MALGLHSADGKIGTTTKATVTSNRRRTDAEKERKIERSNAILRAAMLSTMLRDILLLVPRRTCRPLAPFSFFLFSFLPSVSFLSSFLLSSFSLPSFLSFLLSFFLSTTKLVSHSVSSARSEQTRR